MTSALMAFLHHLAAFVIFGALMVELSLTRSELSLSSARSLVRLDAAYGISAMLLIVIGFVRVFHTEKGSAYYFGSVPFLIKVALFVAIGLLSIAPTREFMSWRKSLQQHQLPVFDEARRRRIRRIIHIELTLLVAILLCAALMARGIGFVG